MEDFSGATTDIGGPDGFRETVDRGRLAGLFCALHRERFTGVLRATSGEHVATIGFRDGSPVTFADSMQAHTLGEELVERGQLTRAQYSTVISRVTDGLVDDETMAFCEHAVALGYLSEADATVELSERIRARLIQVLAWTDCQIEFETGEDALTGRGEFPQDVGAIVYMGVRTFYDDNYLAQSLLPKPEAMFLRLSSAPASIAHFFGLDDDEFRLLRRVDPESPVSHLLAASTQLEAGHALALLVLVRLGEFGELSNTPFQLPEPERSGTRPHPTGARASVPPRLPGQYASVSARPQARPSAPPLSAADAASQASEPSAPNRFPPPPMSTPVRTATVDATQEALLEAAARTAKARKSSSTMRRVAPDPQPSAPQPTTERERPPSTAAANAARAVSRPLSGSIAGEPARNPASPGDPNLRTDYTKAHLNELIQRRKQGAPQSETGSATAKREPQRDLRHARELLREQHHSRAEEMLRGLLQQEPQNEVVRTYHLWSRLRAHPELDDSHVGELTDLAKKLVQDPEHAAFATYMLGHVYLHLKKDDLAEKYFRRAHAADRGNKDAERHLLILERRKQVAADTEAAANRKIFGISLANPKPKP